MGEETAIEAPCVQCQRDGKKRTVALVAFSGGRPLSE